MHGGMGCGRPEPDVEGKRTLEYALAFDLLLGNTCTSMICDLAAAIIRDGKVPSNWEQSFIVCLYKGKGDALDRSNYHGLKLTEQVMEVLERIVDGLI